MTTYICKECKVQKSEAPFCHGPMVLQESADGLPEYIKIHDAIFQLHIGKGKDHYVVSYQTPVNGSILKYITDKTMEGTIKKMLKWLSENNFLEKEK